MGTRGCILVLLVVQGQEVFSQNGGRSINWSSLGFLSGGKEHLEQHRSTGFTQEGNMVSDNDIDSVGLTGTGTGVESGEDYETFLTAESDPEGRIRPYRRKNRFKKRRKQSQDYYSKNNLNRDSGYSSPSSSYGAPSLSYKAPSSSYEAPPSYDTPSTYEAPSYEAPSYTGPSYEAPAYPAPQDSYNGENTFNDFLNALAAFLPIGLFLAAIPPNLIVINSRRKRGVELEENGNSLEKVFSFPFLERIEDIGGFGQLSRNSECQAQLFCLLSSRGLQQEANSIQRLLGYSLNYTPQLVARILNLETVLEASIAGNCEQFKCISRRS